MGCPTENPPHNQFTSVSPRYGIAEKMLVITVAPQKDICPQGRTYPKKAVAMRTMRTTIPVDHTIFFVFGLLFAIPRAMCEYASRNKREAVFK